MEVETIASKNKYRLFLILSCLWALLIFAQSAMPAELSREESQGLLAWLQSLFPWLSHTLLRKLAHMAEYGVLGLFFGLCFHYRGNFKFYAPLGLSLCTAFLDETLQLFIPGRSGEIHDLWVDLSGACLGLLLCLLFRYIQKRRCS